MTAAASTRSGLSPGLSMAVWERFADELFARSARSLKCPINPPMSPGSNAPGTRMKGVGKSPMTSGIEYLFGRATLDEKVVSQSVSLQSKRLQIGDVSPGARSVIGDTICFGRTPCSFGVNGTLAGGDVDLRKA